MITLNFEPIKITDKTKSRCFELYALGDNNGNIFTVGTSNDIAREFCKAKGIEIYAQPEEFKQVADLYADFKKFITLDYSQNDEGLNIETCYDLYFSDCLNDSEFIIYGLRRINNVSSSN